MRKEVKLESSNEIKDFSEYSENKLAIAKICVLSTAHNSHNLEISEEVLRRDIGSIRGNFLVADMVFGEATTHTDREIPVGYFLPNEEIEFEEVETDEGKVVKAWAYAVLSKQYAKSAYEMFVNDNHRATSIEMTVITDEDDENKVLSFDAFGSTILGKTVLPSCKDAEISLIRFAEEAETFFKESNQLTALERFAEERKRTMAEKEKYVSHPINTSKEAVYDGEWDGNKAKQDLVKEKNFKTLAPKVCMKLEEGWENREVTKLGYPVMGLYDGKWRYSAKGLASALGYAKKEKETAVVSKIEKIYKKLGLDSDGKEGQKMEIEFAAVNIRDMWDALNVAIDRKREWQYRIEDIYKENEQLFAILRNWDETEKRYRLDFKYDENGVELSDEIVEVKTEFIETDTIKKFARPEEMRKCEEMPDDSDDEDDDSKEEHDDDSNEEKDEKMSVEDMQAKIDELSHQIEEKENIIMDKENKMSEMSVELESLRNYKATVLARENACAVDALMSEVKPFIDNEKFAEFKAEGLTCTEETFDAWKNKVQAVCFANVSKNLKKNDLGVFTFAAPAENKELKNGSVWDRIKNHNNI